MKSSQKSLPKWVNKLGLLFALSIGCILYLRLGRDYLFDWDEGIYAELGRTLISTKNIFVSFWNGAPWLEKPPGISWVSAIGITLAGPSALGARLLMPLFAIYTLYIVYLLGTRLGSWRHGLIAAGVLATFNLFLGRTRAVNSDMPLLASIVTTILFLLENRPAWWVALAIFGGVWFKGLAGLLSLVIALPLLITKSKSFLFRVSCFLFIFVVPWHLYSFIKFDHDFTNPYFFEQVVKRVTTQIEFHFENRYYYFNYLYTNLGLGALLVAGIGALSSIISRKNLYLLWWVLAPLVLFTLAKTRLFWYILPVYPALALLISEAIGRWGSDKKTRGVIAIIALGIWVQALLVSSRSVEIGKNQVAPPDRVFIALELSKLATSEPLAVLVPPSERLSEALLPEVARLSSSFRYGGMPSVVFYYQGKVEFFYDVDKFRLYWQETQNPVAMIFAEDLQLLKLPYTVVATTPTYLGIQKEIYALR